MRYLFLLPLLFSLAATAQWKEYKLTERKDTFNRVDLRGKKQGPWVIHVEPLRGEPGYEEQGVMIDDQKEGIWRKFSAEGDCIAIESFRFGMKHGKCQYFLNSGEPLREENWRAIDPKAPYDTVAIRDLNDPSKILRYQVVKVEPASYKHGTWTYYNTFNGTVDHREEWVMNKPKDELETAAANSDDDMAPVGVSTNGKSTAKKDDKKPAPKLKEIEDFEKKNSGKKKIKVRDGATGG